MEYFVLFTAVLLIVYLIFGVVDWKHVTPYKLMSRMHTNILKGIAIFMIVWGHIGARLGVHNLQFIGGVGVALFLLCSGYGLYTSYQNNGLKNYWKKKIFKVILPFYLVEIIGLAITGELSVTVILRDFLFIRPATSYGWFMGYLVCCYIIFWIAMKCSEKFKISKISSFAILSIAFAIWFVSDSLFFANPNMPFLWARQMMSFLIGVVLSYGLQNKKLSGHLPLCRSTGLIILSVIFGAGMIEITQLEVIKNLPYILSNMMALFTVLPLAIAVLTFTACFQRVVNNRLFLLSGGISFEIYLVHAFTLSLVEQNMVRVLLFILITFVLAWITHFVVGWVNKKIKL